MVDSNRSENDLSEVELQPFTSSSDRVASSSSWLDSNPHDGSGRRFRYLLGTCFLVVMICSSILYLNHKTRIRAGKKGATDASTPADASYSDTTPMPSTSNTYGLSVQDVLSQRTAHIQVGQQVIPVTPKAYEQIQNFRQGKGLILNLVRSVLCIGKERRERDRSVQ